LPIGGVPKELQQKAKSIAKHVHLSVWFFTVELILWRRQVAGAS
jgi:hypothetical protein